ncbi:MAG TPA: threonine/serine exporter family protein [Actinomycetaceae bacterium]|nr:threonine/serine exporter family protein [Actinomycetaceae bacterium]
MTARETAAVDPYDYGQEPRELIERTDVILRAGQMVLSTGLDSGRCMDFMRIVAKSLDCDAITINIAYPQITATVHRGRIYRTKVSASVTPGVNSDRACEMWDFMLSMRDHMTPAEITKELDRIERKPRLYSRHLLAIAAGVACCAYGILNNMGWYEVIGVFFAVAIAQSLRLFLNYRHVNHLAVVTLAATVAGSIYLGYLLVTQDLPGVTHERAMIGFIAAGLFLVPGFPIVSGCLDLGRLDLASGVNRLTYATLFLLSAGIGMWAVSLFSPVDPTPVPRFDMVDWQILLIKGIASTIGVMGFAMQFNGPMKVCAAAGGVAFFANIVRLVLAEYVVSHHVAVAVAAFMVGILTWLISKYTRWPSVVMAVPATLVMIPGAAAYRTLLYINASDVEDMTLFGLSAVMTVIGLAVGLLAARMLTDKRWALSKDVPPSLNEMLKVRNPL